MIASSPTEDAAYKFVVRLDEGETGSDDDCFCGREIYRA